MYYDQPGYSSGGALSAHSWFDAHLHGYGLYIVKQLMNEVTYCRHLNGNYWYLVKNLHDTDEE
jgi:anti-sigma regulatory factor (Ser/Thr protein kinase)